MYLKRLGQLFRSAWYANCEGMPPTGFEEKIIAFFAYTKSVWNFIAGTK